MLSPPTAEGGALRSQDLRTSADPTSLDGALLRVNPATGAGLSDNPNAASTDANARRIVADGMRNPFRFAVRPGTGEVWIGDVGWTTWEEINRIQNPTAAVTNLGWPCYEGSGRQSGYVGALAADQGKKSWLFKSWSDGGAQTHDVIANSTPTYTASFKQR